MDKSAHKCLTRNGEINLPDRVLCSMEQDGVMVSETRRPLGECASSGRFSSAAWACDVLTSFGLLITFWLPAVATATQGWPSKRLREEADIRETAFGLNEKIWVVKVESKQHVTVKPAASCFTSTRGSRGRNRRGCRH